ADYERNGSLPTEKPFAEGGGLTLFAEEPYATDLTSFAGAGKSVTVLLHEHLRRLRRGDYFALLAFVDMNEEHKAILQSTREHVRNHWDVATSIGFGPRYLHSTGQIFKGGPNTGVFIQL